MANNNVVSFDDVAKAASTMLTKGITPSVRSVMAVVGGKTENVSAFLRDFFAKREAEVEKMADEIGSSAIAKLIASEVQSVVDRKTEQLKDVVQQQKARIDELIELLEEKESDCTHRTELAEAKAAQAINEAKDKIETANDKAEFAQKRTIELEAITEEAKKKSEQEIAVMRQKSDLLIENAKTEAKSLVAAADKRADKAEDEAKNLRVQVSRLTVEQAKREIEQEQLKQVTSELSDSRTNTSKLEVKVEYLEKENTRFQNELKEAKSDSKKLSELQGQLTEKQTQLSQIKADLDRSEREREKLISAFKKDNN